jgi:hypothetical protein
VQASEKWTAEEFFSSLLASTQTLQRASIRLAAHGDVVPAVSCCLGSDIAALESVIWERLNIAPRAPQRQFFEAAEAVGAGLWGAVDEDPHAVVTAADLVSSLRLAMTEALDAPLADEVVQRWTNVGHLGDLAAPSRGDFGEAARERLGGLTPAQYVQSYRAEATSMMREAQVLRVRGETEPAIQEAYASDVKALEAYLVDSAVAAGDHALITVFIRWELAIDAIAQLDQLPSDFPDAVVAIRQALTAGLGEADGARLMTMFIKA